MRNLKTKKQEVQNNASSQQPESFGSFLRNARTARGLTMATLAKSAGIALGQLHKLETDQVKGNINVGHIAALAGPLEVPLYQLYQAAGYPPEQIPLLEPELVTRLMELPPEALRSITNLLDGLMTTGSATWDGPRLAPLPVTVEEAEGENEQEGGAS
ncbi:helix-turn-helix transcriptional regulator [Nostocoides vanveenii]